MKADANSYYKENNVKDGWRKVRKMLHNWPLCVHTLKTMAYIKKGSSVEHFDKTNNYIYNSHL